MKDKELEPVELVLHEGQGVGTGRSRSPSTRW